MANNERVGRALDAVRDGIRPTCETAWAAAYGADWQEEVRRRDRGAIDEAAPDDLMWLLKGMQNTWQEVWRRRFGQAERAYTSELRQFRDNWAHQRSISTRDTDRMLDTAERLLQAFGAAEQLKTVQGLKSDLRRQTYEEEARSERRRTVAVATKGEPASGLKPWRELVTPHADVSSGRLQQAEFAADLYQVASGIAEGEYQDPVSFFARTYLTNGLQELLCGAATRLSAHGGDPVIDLQTNFGGGKTHSMIALYHLASGIPPADLPGVGELFAERGLSLPEQVKRAVVVGQWMSAAEASTKPDGTVVHTIWGEIAWQLAGRDGYELLRAEDEQGFNPGDRLLELFKLAGPSVILIDEWVAYARQLPASEGEPAGVGGSFDTQFTFAQALTEAAASRPDVVLLVAMPASDIEVGGEKGQLALARLGNVVRRKSVQWKPADDDESFEIVRRRLFEPMTPENARIRDGVVKAFCDYYRAHRADFPTESGEADYRRRMELSYPIHPELFDRLYKDWSTLDRFQRTRGVLRLMATVVSVLWQTDDRMLLIQPGSIPIYDSRVSGELTKYLDPAWDAVIKADVDGPTSLPRRLDDQQTRLGRYSASRRSARAVFMASAPQDEARQGIDVKLVSLGIAQPGESPGTFADALRRLSGEATYLYVNGSQYAYALRPNINRLAADRALSNETDDRADDRLRHWLSGRGVGAVSRGGSPFAAVHVFAGGPGDVTDDDDGVHLVVLPPTATHLPSTDTSPALSLADEILRQRSAGPRENRNLLVFCAASEQLLVPLRRVLRQHLAWESILEDAEAKRLELTTADRALAESKRKETMDTALQQVFETYQHILVPEQTPGTAEIRWHQTRPNGTGDLAERIARRLATEERLITSYGGTRVRMDLDRVPLWSERGDVKVEELWRAYCRFPYLPRLASFKVLAEAIADGVSKLSWQSETFAYADGYESGRWFGLVAAAMAPRIAGNGFVVAPVTAEAQLRREEQAGSTGQDESATAAGDQHVPPGVPGTAGEDSSAGIQAPASLPTRFYARFALDPVRAIRQLEDILTNVGEHLARPDGGQLEITLEINANSDGYDDTVQRVVNENAKQLGAHGSEFE